MCMATRLRRLRAAGARVCEFVNLTVDMNSAPKRALACLFHTAYLFAGKVWACDYGVVEAPAQHAEFFCKALGFEPIGEQRANRRVSSQETLLCVHLRTVLERLAALGGKPQLAASRGNCFSVRLLAARVGGRSAPAACDGGWIIR